jgi:hypothetical protein
LIKYNSNNQEKDIGSIVLDEHQQGARVRSIGGDGHQILRHV